MLSPQSITDTLINYRSQRDETKALLKTARILARHLGMAEQDANNGLGALDYLDGWLAGQGSVPTARWRP